MEAVIQSYVLWISVQVKIKNLPKLYMYIDFSKIASTSLILIFGGAQSHQIASRMNDMHGYVYTVPLNTCGVQAIMS